MTGRGDEHQRKSGENRSHHDIHPVRLRPADQHVAPVIFLTFESASGGPAQPAMTAQSDGRDGRLLARPASGVKTTATGQQMLDLGDPRSAILINDLLTRLDR